MARRLRFRPSEAGDLLAAAAKGGRKDRLVYKRLIELADARFDAYLDTAPVPRSYPMPVSLEEMMKALPPEDRVRIERTTSSLVADYRTSGASDSEAGRYAPIPAAIGTKVMTGQQCPESGVWRVENVPSATAPITVHNLMPPYRGQTVVWELVRHLAA